MSDFADENVVFLPPVGTVKIVHPLQQKVEDLEARIAALEAKAASGPPVLEADQDWINKDYANKSTNAQLFAIATDLLKAGGVSLYTVSLSRRRHVVDGLRKLIEEVKNASTD